MRSRKNTRDGIRRDERLHVGNVISGTSTSLTSEIHGNVCLVE